MIYGHERNLEYFERIIQRGEFSHAYGLIGMKGIGKSSFARHVAEQLAKQITASPSQYHLFFSHDFLHIQKKDNKILVEEIEKLAEFYSMKSNFGKKIAIIDDFDVISEQMQNKLLKLLEEPPADALIFLIIENKYRVLPTILSRLSLVNFNPLSMGSIQKIIRENGYEYDEDVLRLSFGSMNYYFKWFDSDFKAGVNRIFDMYYEIIFHSFMGVEECSKVLISLEEYGLYVLDLLIRIEQDMMILLEGNFDRSVMKFLNIIDCVDKFRDFSRLQKEKNKIEHCLLRMDEIKECKRKMSNSQNENLIYDTFLFNIIRRTYDKCSGY